MGEVIRKSNLNRNYKPNLFGIDLNQERVRFYYMGHYHEYSILAQIPLGDEQWHFIGVTFR